MLKWHLLSSSFQKPLMRKKKNTFPKKQQDLPSLLLIRDISPGECSWSYLSSHVSSTQWYAKAQCRWMTLSVIKSRLLAQSICTHRTGVQIVGYCIALHLQSVSSLKEFLLRSQVDWVSPNLPLWSLLISCLGFSPESFLARSYQSMPLTSVYIDGVQNFQL